VRIELVGGPLDGALAEVEFLNDTVRLGYFGDEYRRRDMGYFLDPIARERCFGTSGDRLYDYVKPDQKG
jgi:hypothetical protein